MLADNDWFKGAMSLALALGAFALASCALPSQSPGAGSAEQGNTRQAVNSAPAIHKIFGNFSGSDAVGLITETSERSLFITITSGSDSEKGLTVTSQGSAPRFCILKFVRPDDRPFDLARDLPCYASAKDLVSSKPEFRNETPGYYSPEEENSKEVFAAVKLLCDASNSKNPADRMKCLVKPFLPSEGVEIMCKTDSGKKAAWGRTLADNYQFLCLGRFVPISVDSFKAYRW